MHREVMAWVKEWDHCVFGRRQGVTRGVKRQRGEDGENADEWKRPKEKVRLAASAEKAGLMKR